MIPHSAPCIGQEEADACLRVLHSGHLAQGREVEAFERECAEFVGRRHAVAVNSGTSALHLALDALGIANGDPVAVPSYACAALITAVTLQRARPVLCDSGPEYNLDPEGVNPDAAVIVPHLFGAPAPIPDSRLVIEDVAQSMGGPTGKAGIVTVTSFYATKLMTSGEGGMLLTDDEGFAAHARDRRDYDNRDEFVPRYNYKMTDLQAAIGREQLKKLPGFIARRRATAHRYQEAFASLALELPDPRDHVFFRYVVGTDARDTLEADLRQDGIEAKRPVYRPAHHYFGGSFPAAQRAYERCLSLPIYPSLVEDDVTRVIESVRRFAC